MHYLGGSGNTDKEHGLHAKPPMLPRRSLQYIHQDVAEMNTLK